MSSPEAACFSWRSFARLACHPARMASYGDREWTSPKMRISGSHHDRCLEPLHRR
jgi:hypothetical protein